MKKLLSLAALLAVACKKEAADPGPTGANTFSCRIEGRDFTPYISPASQPFTGPKIKALDIGYDKDRHALILNARTTGEKLELYVRPTRGQGVYALGYTQGTYPYDLRPSDYGGYSVAPVLTDPYGSTIFNRYTTDATNTGTVTITRFDTVAHVAGGTFAYTARAAATGQVVHVTNGKFDVKF